MRATAHKVSLPALAPSPEKRTRPAQLDELDARFARFLVLHNHSSAHAEVAVPPSLVEPTGIWSDAQLDVALGIRLCARGFEPRREGIDVAGDHGDAVARFVRLSNRKSNDGTPIARDQVFTAGLDLAFPTFARR